MIMEFCDHGAGAWIALNRVQLAVRAVAHVVKAQLAAAASFLAKPLNPGPDFFGLYVTIAET